MKVNWFSTYHVHHRVAARFREGRAFLLGDAAHIHSPVGGQGMNTGIGDAVNLAWKLAAVLKADAAESLLDTYEPERIAFARRLVATTDRGVHACDEAGRRSPGFVRTRLVPLIGAVAVPAARGAPLPVPHRVADRRQLSQQPTERGRGRGRPGRRSPALGRDAAGKRQLRTARRRCAGRFTCTETRVASGRSLRATSASAPPLRVAAGHARRGTSLRDSISSGRTAMSRWSIPTRILNA